MKQTYDIYFQCEKDTKFPTGKFKVITDDGAGVFLKDKNEALYWCYVGSVFVGSKSTAYRRAKQMLEAKTFIFDNTKRLWRFR